MKNMYMFFKANDSHVTISLTSGYHDIHACTKFLANSDILFLECKLSSYLIT